MQQSFIGKSLRVLLGLVVIASFLVTPHLNQPAAASPLAASTFNLISPGDPWKYLDNGSDQGTAWKEVGFDDSKWKNGDAEFGYGDGDEETVVSYGSSKSNKYVTTYFRSTFSAGDPAMVTKLALSVKRDDAAVVYINGNEVFRSNMPDGDVKYRTYAVKAEGKIDEKDLDRSVLVKGENTIAVEIHQSDATSSDISFDLMLKVTIDETIAPTAVPPTPTSAPTQPSAATATAAPTQPAATQPAPTQPAPTQAPLKDTFLIDWDTTWKYLDNGSNQGTNWTSPSFNDSTWKSGVAELGYGDGDEKTVVQYGSSSSKYVVTYFRQTFEIADISGFSKLYMQILRDDGAVVYLNGKEIFRSNMPTGTITYTTLALSADGSTLTTFLPITNLVRGKNVVAVEIHQSSRSSSDLSFNLGLVAMVGTPETQPTATAVPTVAPTVAPTPAPTMPSTSGNSWYAATNGSSSGRGTKDSPWDLKTALSGPSAVRPGDTIWVRGGSYNYRSLGYFYSYVKGTSSAPVTIRAYPGERVTLDAALVIEGEYATIWGLEIMNANTNRYDTSRTDGIIVWAPGTKLINNIVHDTDGVGFWWEATNAEMYGNLIYNTGSQGSDRGHGHNLYTTNQSGMKQISDNIMFNTFSGINVHAYSEKTYLNGFHFEGNFIFNGRTIIGGTVPASNVEMINNYFFRGMARMGYSSSITNKNLVLKGNYFDGEGGEDALMVTNWSGFNVSGNRMRNSGSDLSKLAGSRTGSTWNGNTYFTNDSSPFGLNGSSLSWSSWKSQTGFDGSSSLANNMPGGVEVIVRPNRYEPKRGNVAVYNWSQQGSVSIDLAAMGFQPGDAYVIHNAQNFYAETIKGTYTGSPVSIPMTGWSIAKPIGWGSALRPTTFPTFGTFIIAQY